MMRRLCRRMPVFVHFVTRRRLPCSAYAQLIPHARSLIFNTEYQSFPFLLHGGLATSHLRLCAFGVSRLVYLALLFESEVQFTLVGPSALLE